MTSPAVVQAALARRWARRHPQFAPAITRALALVGGVERVGHDLYEVEGAGEIYRVAVSPGERRATCSCPAWRYAAGPRPRCKHSFAVALALSAETKQTEENVNNANNHELLSRIDAALAELKEIRRLVAGDQPAPPPAHPRATATGSVVPQGAIASDDDLDGRYGNPEIRRDPPRWTGESMVGRKYSDCPPEYLDTLAGFHDWRADQDDKKGDPRAKWPRLDAARARGWARRIRQQQGGGGETPRGPEEPEQDVDDVPF